MSEKSSFQEMCSDELNKLLDQEKLQNNSDVWNKINLQDSRYIWLPIKMVANKPIIKWMP